MPGLAENTSAIAVIPARAGSKRLPGKNTAPLGGKPLLAWTVDAALESECFGDIVVTSDIPAALELASAAPFPVRGAQRPPDLAGDAATTPQVMAELAMREGWLDKGIQRICLLLPTTPFRTARHIREARDRLDGDCDSVVSMAAYAIPPEWAFRFGENEILQSVQEAGSLAAGKTRTQGLPNAYHPNGAIYWGWLKAFLETGSFFSGKVRGYAMPTLDSLDIDRPEDLLLAEAWIHRGASPPQSA
jgi:CMP-N-acetylneuraminic acid synthetase